MLRLHNMARPTDGITNSTTTGDRLRKAIRISLLDHSGLATPLLKALGSQKQTQLCPLDRSEGRGGDGEREEAQDRRKDLQELGREREGERERIRGKGEREREATTPHQHIPTHHHAGVVKNKKANIRNSKHELPELL